MIVVVIASAALWGLGVVMRAPVWQRGLMIAVIWAGFVAVQPWVAAGGPLALGDSGKRLIFIIFVLTALGLIYRYGLGLLRQRVTPIAPVKAAFSEVELERYARHIMLREIGGPGQNRLKAARVLVIGAGGLGSPALLYLAAAGVGCIGIVDDDVVDASNLQRQIIHTDQRIGMGKTASAAVQMRALNPFVTVRQHAVRLTDANAEALLRDYDLVLDGSDNFDTRYLVNRVAARLGKPLISGAISQWEGQISLYDPANGTPCYECVFADRPAPGMVPTCAEAGVVAPLPGVIGAIMATEAVKHISGAGQTLRGRLMIHDALYGEVRVIDIARRADCAVCGSGH